jgi:2-succinyl-5-enolpyruvyl-6-hydroxy-3-cyclohexene-1-carboxylate synthase
MKATNPTEAAALTIVDELARCGVQHACLAPGSRSAPLALALAEHDGIAVHVSLDERSAAFMAVGIGRTTGAPSVVLSTSGTAAANFFPAVQEASLGRVPLLVMTADRPPELRATGANQWIDQLKLYGSAVRWFVEVGVPEPLPTSVPYWRSTAARAVTATTGSPPGPVHLNLPFREPLVTIPSRTSQLGAASASTHPPKTAERRAGHDDGVAAPENEIVFPFDLDGRPDGAPWVDVTGAPRALDDDALAELAGHLTGRRGLVVAGAGPHGDVPALELAERLRWPLLADPLSNLRTDERVISTYDALLRHAPFADGHRPDVVLRIGALGISKALMAFLAGCDNQILIDPDGAWLDPDRSVARIVAADPSRVSEGLLEHVSGPPPPEWLDDWRAADAAARKTLDTQLDAGNLSEPRVARDVVAGVPDGASLMVAASMPFRDVEWFSSPRSGVHFYGNRGVNGIDGFVSTALGLALATDGPTYALCGDLSLLHDQSGFMTAAKYDGDLTFVVVNNDGGGIFSFLPQAGLPEHFEELFGTPQGIDFAKLAALHDCTHVLATTPDELTTALKPAGIQLVEIRTDRDENVRVHRELNRAVARTLG